MGIKSKIPENLNPGSQVSGNHQLYMLYSTPCMNMLIQAFSLARMNRPKERFNLFSDKIRDHIVS